MPIYTYAYAASYVCVCCLTSSGSCAANAYLYVCVCCLIRMRMLPHKWQQLRCACHCLFKDIQGTRVRAVFALAAPQLHKYAYAASYVKDTAIELAPYSRSVFAQVAHLGRHSYAYAVAYVCVCCLIRMRILPHAQVAPELRFEYTIVCVCVCVCVYGGGRASL
jgi:hypothetical protein